MSEQSMTRGRAGDWASAAVTAVLSAVATVAVLFGLALALDHEDTEPLESPLLMAVAHQLIRGPWDLYGPYGGRNPWVLIHAPLYYHVAALLAWPMYRAGLAPVLAARTAGRLLSFLGFAWTLGAAYKLARLDGAPKSAGLWSMLLIAASPVVGAMPYTVRPDTLGVALQTTGVFLVLSALCSERPRGITLQVAYIAFGLASCVKQHYLMAVIVSTVLLLVAWLRGRLSFQLVARGLFTGLAIVLIVYGTEELATGGYMSRAVFQAAATTSRVHPGDWFRASIVLCGVLGNSTGLIALLAAAGLAGIDPGRGIGRRILVGAGIGQLGLLAVQSSLDLLGKDLAVWEMLIAVANVAAAAFLVIPACYWLRSLSLSTSPLDRALWIYAAAEFALVIILSRLSTGAWLNYGIPAIVFVSVVTARALARACASAPSPRTALLVALASLVLLIGVSSSIWSTAQQRLVARQAVRRIFDHFGRPSSEYFFAARAGDNRVHGRPGLVYDDWLYPVFESIHLAEPRSIWLRRAVTSDDIRFIVKTSDAPSVDGLGEPLADLGFIPSIQVGPFYVWERVAFRPGTRPR